MSDYVSTKRAMKRYAPLHGIKIPPGFNPNTDVWGDHARALAWNVSAHLQASGHKDVPHSRGCTAMLTWHLVRFMPAAVALGYVSAYWYSHRDASHYSYPSHSAARMQVGAFPSVATWTDCSGMIRCQWHQLGWPDPAGAGYGIWGNSEGMLAHARAHGRLISRGSERMGDIVTYSGGVGHAELVVARGRVLTNGNEAGPYYRGIGQHSGTMHICRVAPFL